MGGAYQELGEMMARRENDRMLRAVGEGGVTKTSGPEFGGQAVHFSTHVGPENSSGRTAGS